MNLLPATALALSLAYAGMAGLCMAMDRHHEQLTGRRDVPIRLRWALRLAAGVLLLASLHVSINGWGPGVGWVAWLGYLTTSALLVAGLWAWRPLLAMGFAAAGGACSLLVFVASTQSSVPA